MRWTTVKVPAPTAGKLQLHPDTVSASRVDELFSRQFVPHKSSLVITSSIVQTVEANRALGALSLGLVRPRAEWIGIRGREGRVTIQTVAGDQLKAIREGLDDLFFTIMSESGVEQVVSAKRKSQHIQ